RRSKPLSPFLCRDQQFRRHCRVRLQRFTPRTHYSPHCPSSPLSQAPQIVTTVSAVSALATFSHVTPPQLAASSISPRMASRPTQPAKPAPQTRQSSMTHYSTALALIRHFPVSRRRAVPATFFAAVESGCRGRGAIPLQLSCVRSTDSIYCFGGPDCALV
ncbi:hypothetical protein K432DRAFT_455765, partial [Lepidopterella palustris CBS 459.81]